MYNLKPNTSVILACQAYRDDGSVIAFQDEKLNLSLSNQVGEHVAISDNNEALDTGGVVRLLKAP